MLIILGLGSNIGSIADKKNYLKQAVEYLADFITDIKVSKEYYSKALLPKDADPSWDLDFINIVITGECNLDPQEILKRIKTIENQIGRKNRGHWGPREIDIDILAIENLVIDTENLIIPHKYLAQRDFVIIPLCEVAPNWRHPILKKNSLELKQEILYD